MMIVMRIIHYPHQQHPVLKVVLMLSILIQIGLLQEELPGLDIPIVLVNLVQKKNRPVCNQ